ncbi:MAG: hypothetical protein NXI01_00805 [Gammaproteobacteria bacterium]|nr:hypothetical protein [Gammaproteobacteria bacterium]
MPILLRMIQAFQQAGLRDANNLPYTEASLVTILAKETCAMQRELAVPLRNLAVHHLRTSNQSRAIQFRKSCDLYIVNGTESYEQLTRINRTSPNTYIFYPNQGSIIFYAKNEHNEIVSQEFALTKDQSSALTKDIEKMDQKKHDFPIPLDWDDITNIRTVLGNIFLTFDPIERPYEIDFLRGQLQTLSLPDPKKLSETEHPSRTVTLDQWLRNEARNGTWGADDSASALAEALDCDLIIRRRHGPLSEFSTTTSSAPTLMLQHNGSNHWESATHPNTLGDGNCLFNAIGLELRAVYLAENYQLNPQVHAGAPPPPELPQLHQKAPQVQQTCIATTTTVRPAQVDTGPRHKKRKKNYPDSLFSQHEAPFRDDKKKHTAHEYKHKIPIKPVNIIERKMIGERAIEDIQRDVVDALAVHGTKDYNYSVQQKFNQTYFVAVSNSMGHPLLEIEAHKASVHKGFTKDKALDNNQKARLVLKSMGIPPDIPEEIHVSKPKTSLGAAILQLHQELKENSGESFEARF